MLTSLSTIGSSNICSRQPLFFKFMWHLTPILSKISGGIRSYSLYWEDTVFFVLWETYLWARSLTSAEKKLDTWIAKRVTTIIYHQFQCWITVWFTLNWFLSFEKNIPPPFLFNKPSNLCSHIAAIISCKSPFVGEKLILLSKWDLLLLALIFIPRRGHQHQQKYMTKRW